MQPKISDFLFNHWLALDFDYSSEKDQSNKEMETNWIQVGEGEKRAFTNEAGYIFEINIMMCNE